MDLSIVIPVYNEEVKIVGDITATEAFLENHNLSGQIIISDDGSIDGTAAAVRELARKHDNVILIANEHRGKGHALRKGVEAVRAEHTLFMDSGSCVPIEACLKGLEMIRRGDADFAFGSRRMAGSEIITPQSAKRKLTGSVFRMLTYRMFDLPEHLTDTQCGFKVFQTEKIKTIVAECRCDGFLIDLEIIIRAQKRNIRVAEFPLRWTCDTDSRLYPMKNLKNIVKEFAYLRKVAKS